MSQGSILGVKREKLSNQEKRKRIVFFLKLLIFLFIMIFKEEFIRFVALYLEIAVKAVEAFLFFITAHLVISFSRLLLVNLYIRRNSIKDNVKNNFVLGINRLADMLSAIFLFIAILTLFRISVWEFFTGISIVAAAIAILSKDYISNLINGLIIMFSDQLSLDDYVQIGQHKGKIVDITFLNIQLVNEDEDLVYIPNTTVFSTEVVNFTKQPVNKLSIDFELPVKYAGMDVLEEYLKKTLANFSSNIVSNSYVLKVARINKDSLLLKYQFILKHENREMEKQIRRLLPRKVVEFINQTDKVENLD
ncbi:MAG: mechanosensitive ion channel family protein [Candidatus Cyclobacteriaceae bacterium M3_2C_046]